MQSREWRVGDVLETDTVTSTMDVIEGYSAALRPASAPPRTVPTIHNSYDFAQRKGWRAPVGFSPQLTAQVYRMLCRNFGEPAVLTGSISLTFTPPFYVDETVTAKGRIVDVAPVSLSSDTKEVLVEIWCEDEAGAKIAAGRAVAQVDS